jgi:hypothetical protein
MKNIYSTIIFLAHFASPGPGVLDKGPTVFLDGVRPANTCIPSWGMRLHGRVAYPQTKYVCEHKKWTFGCLKERN